MKYKRKLCIEEIPPNFTVSLLPSLFVMKTFSAYNLKS